MDVTPPRADLSAGAMAAVREGSMVEVPGPMDSGSGPGALSEENRARLFGLVPPPGVVTGELNGPIGTFMMAILQRLRLSDRQLRSSVADMRARNRVADGMQQGVEILQRLRGVGNMGDADGTIDASADMGQLDFVRGTVTYRSTEAGHEGETLTRRETLGEVAARLSQQYGISLDLDEDGNLTGETIDAALQTMSAKITRLNSSSELDMISLQSVNESRSSQFRLLSQILNGEHDTMQSIIGNVQ